MTYEQIRDMINNTESTEELNQILAELSAALKSIS